MRKRTLRLCKPQAISITESEQPKEVKRRVSLTIRQRLMPEITCSTLTRTEDITLLKILSARLNSLPFGFFLVDDSKYSQVHSLENLYLYPDLS